MTLRSSSNAIGEGRQRLVNIRDGAENREDFTAVELLFKRRASRSAIRKDIDVVSLVGGDSSRGINANTGDHAGDHHILDATFLQKTVQSRFGEGAKSLLSWKLNDPVVEFLQRVHCSRTGGGLAERPQLLDGLEDAHRVFQFSVVVGEGDGRGDRRHAREQRPLEKTKGVWQDISVLDFLTDRTVEQAVCAEEIILITDEKDGCFCGIHLHV